MKCDQCELLWINGLACHEIGCPNTPIGQCASCDAALTKAGGKYFANDWDGITYCKDCAARVAQYEAEESEGAE